MKRISKQIHVLAIVTLLMLVTMLPVAIIQAQAVSLSFDGPAEVSIDQQFGVELALNAVTDLSSVTIVLRYDPELIRFAALDSQYLTYDEAGSTGNNLMFRTSGTAIPEGLVNLGTLILDPISTGISRFDLISMSTFADDGSFVGANAIAYHNVTIHESGDYIELPTPMPTTDTTPTTNVDEPAPVPTDPDITTITGMPTSDVKETTTESVTETTEQESSELESSSTIMPSTSQAETSTISTELASSETTESSASDTDNTKNNLNGFRLVAPIVVLLLVAALLTTVLISRRK